MKPQFTMFYHAALQVWFYKNCSQNS